MRAAYLVGVDHRIQYTPSGCGPESEWGMEIRKLEDYLVSKAVELDVELLAEEFHEDLLETNNASDCTVREAAYRCGRKHLFCDISPGERQRIGINTDDEREMYWLNKLQESDAASVLFVCGMGHISSFSEKLSLLGVSTEVLSRGWGEDWMVKNC